VKERINKLVELIADEINEKSAFEIAMGILDQLRIEWKRDKYQFEREDILVLSKIAKKVKAIGEFIELLDEFDYINTKEEAEEIILRLNELNELIGNGKITLRIKKEIRELIEKREKLPSFSERQYSVDLMKAINKLEKNPPACHKCGRPMVLREGGFSFFWGCSIFPHCWGKKYLSRSESAMLPD
jgi:hypothetical protein